ncbi:MAG TPA: hypothetical protein DEO32_06250 [Ruminococcaceae bacterium]|nr:hypothetical protein [Oscillospiraceae bacterium]
MKHIRKIISSLLAAAVCLGGTAAFGAGAVETVKNDTQRVIIGDVNGDNTVNIKDVTDIQRWLVSAKKFNEAELDAADVNQNKEVKINDATLIQVYLAGDLSREGSFCGMHKKGEEIIKVNNFTIYDFLNWGSFTIIAKDKSGNILPVPEPVFTETHAGFESTDKFDEYSVPVPGDAYSLTAVNSDGTKQTAELENLNPRYSSVYGITDYGKDEEHNYYLVDCEIHWAYPPTFNFFNTLGWQKVYAYKFSSADGVSEQNWPGEELTPLYDDYGQDYYEVYCGTEGFDSIILNDGEGNQTSIITDFAPDNGYYYLKYDAFTINEYGAKAYTPLQEHDVPPVDENKELSFHFIDTLGWENVYMFAYDDSGETLNGDWPGDKLSSVFTDDFSQNHYLIDVPKGAQAVVIHDNNNSRTIIPADFEDGAVFYLDKDKVTTDEDGQKTYDCIELYFDK